MIMHIASIDKKAIIILTLFRPLIEGETIKANKVPKPPTVQSKTSDKFKLLKLINNSLFSFIFHCRRLVIIKIKKPIELIKPNDAKLFSFTNGAVEVYFFSNVPIG